jgi:methylenetetrahydrofolate reductase (NADPH)
VKIGIPGPTSVKSLLNFAARCGVRTSSRVMSKYGLSLAKLVNQAGPDVLVWDLEANLHHAIHGDVRMHLYPFGGVLKTVEWVRNFRSLRRAG